MQTPSAIGGRWGKSGMRGVVTAVSPYEMEIPDIWGLNLGAQYQYTLDLWWDRSPGRTEEDSLPEPLLEKWEE